MGFPGYKHILEYIIAILGTPVTYEKGEDMGTFDIVAWANSDSGNVM